MKELVKNCRSEIGAFASPDVMHWAPQLPKTRSGKIMRRILRKIAANQVRTHVLSPQLPSLQLSSSLVPRLLFPSSPTLQVSDDDFGDTSTLADPSVVGDLVESRPNK